MKKYLSFLTILAVMSSCGSYQTLLKKGSIDEKFAAAKNYFLEKKYMRASTLLGDVAQANTDAKTSEEVLYLLGESYMGMDDYFSASEYYRTYIKNYPKGIYIQDCRFQIGYCMYLDSPDARLDQQSTLSAISSFEDFIQIYPGSDKVPQAYTYIEELKNKLAYKGFLEAKLYYNLGIYLGNNYSAAVVVAENVLKTYPENKYREELSFLILKSKYSEAKNSVAERYHERFSEVIDEYYRYANEFQNSKNIKEAEKIFSEAKKQTKKSTTN